MRIAYDGKTPLVGRNVFIAPSAVLIGDVVIEDEASIWFNAVIRGDMAPIRIGRRTNIQDNCTLHVDTGYPLVVGADVTIGHNAVVHGCTVDDQALIGLQAVVLNGAVIGRQAMVAAGALVRQGQQVPNGALVAGVPAQVKKQLPPMGPDQRPAAVRHYMELAAQYRAQLAAEHQ